MRKLQLYFDVGCYRSYYEKIGLAGIWTVDLSFDGFAYGQLLKLRVLVGPMLQLQTVKFLEL